MLASCCVAPFMHSRTACHAVVSVYAAGTECVVSLLQTMGTQPARQDSCGWFLLSALPAALCMSTEQGVGAAAAAAGPPVVCGRSPVARHWIVMPEQTSMVACGICVASAIGRAAARLAQAAAGQNAGGCAASGARLHLRLSCLTCQARLGFGWPLARCEGGCTCC